MSPRAGKPSPEGHQAKPGDPCPFCGHHLIVVNTSVLAERFRRQYIGCRRCGKRPLRNKRVVALST